MLDRLKIYLKNKWEGTIFSEAQRLMMKVWSKNKIAFIMEMVGIYLLSAYLTGMLVISVFNLTSGGGYSYSLKNIVNGYIRFGILISFLVWLLIQLLIYKFIILFKKDTKRDERGYDVSEEHTYGDADLMTPERMRKKFIVAPIEENKATIFGRDPHDEKMLVAQKHPQLKINRNCFIVAGPSAGKSATFIIPLILQIIRRGESAIISDPKSELFAILSELAKRVGYEVRLLSLNPMFLKNSDPCNFLMYVGEDVDKAQVVANAIINTTTGAADMLDFWTEGALNILQAIILRITVGHDYMPEEKNLPQLFTYLTTHELEELEEDFETLPDSHPAKAPFKIFKDGKEDVKRQVLQGLGIKLKLYNSPTLRKILSETKYGLDVLNPGRKKCLYFIGSNDQDSSMSSVVSLFYTLEYQELVRYADMRIDRELPITVHMVLDEYANMAAIPDFEKKLSTVRSRGIVTYVVCQDINQLKTKHPNDTWKTVLNDCDYFMLLKTNDQDTMDWFSKMSGEQTKTVKNKGYMKSKTDLLNIHNEEHINQGQGQGLVMTSHQVRTLKENELLLMMTQENMLKLHTFFWKDHPYAKYITKETEILPAQHYPFWRLIDDGVVDEDFDYDHEPSFIMELPEDDKLEIDEDYDPDAMLGVDSASKKATKKLKKVIKKKIKKDETGEKPKKKVEKIDKLVVRKITQEEIEERKAKKRGAQFEHKKGVEAPEKISSDIKAEKETTKKTENAGKKKPKENASKPKKSTGTKKSKEMKHNQGSLKDRLETADTSEFRGSMSEAIDDAEEI